jgi:site-specific recombinase XerC
LKVNRITTAKIEEFIANRQCEGMNIATLRKILVTLGQILAYAVRHRYIDYNPLPDAERPRGKGNTGKENQDPDTHSNKSLPWMPLRIRNIKP